MAITCSTNPEVLCNECLTRPVIVLNAHQSKLCGQCLSDRWRLLGGLFSDLTMQLDADRFDELMASAPMSETGQANA